jgi:hypothetical protein
VNDATQACKSDSMERMLSRPKGSAANSWIAWARKNTLALQAMPTNRRWCGNEKKPVSKTGLNLFFQKK